VNSANQHIKNHHQNNIVIARSERIPLGEGTKQSMYCDKILFLHTSLRACNEITIDYNLLVLLYHLYVLRQSQNRTSYPQRISLIFKTN
jgi:hypothetical protein